MSARRKSEAPESARLVSLDALRGFDMFWIIGGSGLVVALVTCLRLPDPWVQELALQMTHVEWEGFRFFDLIFPLFVFMAGVAVPYALLSKLQKGVSVAQLQGRVVRRSIMLILIGLSFSIFKFQSDQVRLYTVLWLIGMSYLIGASLSLRIPSWRNRVVIFFAVLMTYHLAILYLPYPGKGPEITPANNLAAWLDRNLIPTNLYRGHYDPEGTIRVIPGGMLCLLGVLVGQRIRHFGGPATRCGLELLAGGLACLALGWGWSLTFPIIKDLWSPSFILWSAGWSLLLLGCFYLMMDVWKQRWVGWVFLPIGMNAIFIYATQWYVPWRGIRDFFFRGYSETLENPEIRQLVLAAGLVLVQWLVLWWLYRKKQFIRL